MCCVFRQQKVSEGGLGRRLAVVSEEHRSTREDLDNLNHDITLQVLCASIPFTSLGIHVEQMLVPTKSRNFEKKKHEKETWFVSV